MEIAVVSVHALVEDAVFSQVHPGFSVQTALKNCRAFPVKEIPIVGDSEMNISTLLEELIDEGG